MYKRVNFERLFIIIYILSIFLILNIAYGKPLDDLEYGYNALNDNLKVCFEDVSIVKGVGVDLNNSYAKIIGDNSLVINASNLSYPGAGIEYEAIIKNNGLLPAKLIGINTYGINEDDDIIVINRRIHLLLDITFFVRNSNDDIASIKGVEIRFSSF